MAAYDGNFYDVIRAGTQASAAVVVPLLYGLFHPRTVIDVGCGEGWWGATFAALGAEVDGVDGAYVGAKAPGITFIPADLAHPLDIDGSYDLAISLEVAEHLPPERAASFVDDLCSLAPVVVFSAAVPGQGGTGHLNEQWPAYWSTFFHYNGYRIHEDLRWLLWNDDRVECWYRQNLLVAVRGGILTDPPLHFVEDPLAIVHPILYDARRGA